MRYPKLSILIACATAVVAPGGLSAQEAYDPAAYQVEDTLEARVWLDRGPEAVVEPGDEVRVYYRTSHDAFAAIFRIDTDGRVSLLYPQHPDVDPFVAGGRDYRLIFPDSPRWRVREDPGVGYFFMVASRVPLDFSQLGYDADDGWDLRGVGESVYEDPYVAIDDYVAALLPNWDSTPYALDFLEYSVGAAHDYPRFLCYDCHGFRSYAAWNPYSRLCSSYTVVVWDDPYFYPRFRYVGTRVVFARPLYPRPRYTFSTRVIGSTRGPIVRTRPAPPRRTAVYKESPRGGPTVVPARGSRAGSAPVRATPSASRSAPAASRVDPRAGSRMPPGASRGAAAGARTAPAAGRRVPATTRPSGRLDRPAVGRPDRLGPGGTGAAARSERPTLRRRVPAARPPGSDPRAAPRSDPRATRGVPRAGSGDRGRPTARPPDRRPPPGGAAATPRARPTGPPTRPRAGARPPPASRPTARPPRPGGRPGGSGAAPSRPGGRPGGAAPSRPNGRPGGASAAPSRPGGRPGGGSAAPSRPGGRPGGASAAPSRPGGRPGGAAPSRPGGRPGGASARAPRPGGRPGGPPRGSRPPPGRPDR